MDFAADAVIEIVPPARAPARASANRTDPSFDDHLNAATADADSAETESAPRTEASADTSTDDRCETPTGEKPEAVAVATPPAPPQTPAPVLLQLINFDAQPPAPPPQDTPVENVEAPAAAPPRDTLLAKGAQLIAPPVAARPAAEAQPEASDNAAEAPTEQASLLPKPVQPVAATESSALPPTQQQAPQQAGITQAATPPAQTQPATPPPSSTAAVTPPAMTQAATTPTPRPAAPQQPGEAAKVEGPRNAKAEAAAAKAAEQAATQTKAAAPNLAATVIDAATQPAQLDQSIAQAQSHLHAAASTSAAHTQHAVLDQSAARAAPAATQVAREIVRRFDGETTRFELRLDPPELGKVEVRLEVSRDHRVTAVVAADSPQALTELARHARDLEQALQSAGLELTDNGLSFDLKQSHDGEGENSQRGGGESAGAEEQLTETPAGARPLGFERWRGVRVDVMI